MAKKKTTKTLKAKKAVKKKKPAAKKTAKKAATLIKVKRPIKNEGNMPIRLDIAGELKVGSMAPNFSVLSSDGRQVSLPGLRGKRVVLYFYPKDMTGGCTIEANEFTELAKKFTAGGTLVYGVSPDSIESHMKFIGKEGIAFPLLSDEGHKVAEMFGVWVKKSMYGREYMGIERSTFVIGLDGKLEAVYRKVSAPGHALCVLSDIGK